MFSFFFKKKEHLEVLPLQADMHSHLLPGLDDGSDSIEESMEMITEFANRGYKRLYTTPHIIHDYYPNSAGTILPALAEVRKAIRAARLDITIDAAAEYFLDENFMEKIEQNQPLLTFSDKYVLFETPFLNEPVYLRDVIFKLHSNGYKPVLAHPERYQYLFGNWKKVEELFDTGVLFQVNNLSFVGHYNKGAQVLAEGLVQREMIHFIGTDCHKPRHLESMKLLVKSKAYRRALEFPLLNHQI